MNGKIQRVKMGADGSESARLSVCEGEARYRREGLCRCMCEGRCNPQLDVGDGVLRRKAGAEREQGSRKAGDWVKWGKREAV